MSLILIIHSNGVLTVHHSEEPTPHPSTDEDCNILKEIVANSQGFNSISAQGNDLEILDRESDYTILIEDAGEYCWNPNGSLLLHSMHAKRNGYPFLGMANGYVAICDGKKRLDWDHIETIVAMLEDIFVDNPAWNSILNLS